MFSHVTVGVADLTKSIRFYDALLKPLGLSRRNVAPDGGPQSACWHRADQALPRFYVYLPFDGRPASCGNGTMVAFAAQSPAAVRAAHTAGLLCGGRDEGAPGPRAHYGQGYFGAYLRDPDGNKLHIVHRRELQGSSSDRADQ